MRGSGVTEPRRCAAAKGQDDLRAKGRASQAGQGCAAAGLRTHHPRQRSEYTQVHPEPKRDERTSCHGPCRPKNRPHPARAQAIH
eukprot:3612275-Rhodomonas_salina.1